METLSLLKHKVRNVPEATRLSLLQRLGCLEDQQSWQEFFNKYWRLIYSTARRAGLQDAEAQDLVQETVTAVAKQMEKAGYDPSKGSFKAWLLTITKRRIADYFRKMHREQGLFVTDCGASGAENPAGAEVLDQADNFEGIWDEEWARNLIELALERVKRKANPRNIEAFYLSAVHGQSASQVARALGMNIAQVYLAKHRVTVQLKREIKGLSDLGFGLPKA